MTFNDYQDKSRQTAIYPQKYGLEYTILGLCSESGELAGKYKKIIRDKQGIVTGTEKEALMDELSDVLWYCANIAYEIGYKLDDVAEHNINKLFSRKDRGVLSGSGDNR